MQDQRKVQSHSAQRVSFLWKWDMLKVIDVVQIVPLVSAHLCGMLSRAVPSINDGNG